jgi:hypothetical protein
MSELSPKGLQLILDYEVGGGEAYYKRYLSRPTWPGGESGVTVGVGYDLGYTPRDRFQGDWHALDDEVRDRLAATIGTKGVRARERTKEVKDIVIPWGMAFEVFQRRTLPFWIEQTKKAFPGVEALPWDVLGALTSLVFNRGPAMDGERRREMRNIRTAVQERDLEKIARNLRAMKRLWQGKGLPGLLKRREAEAEMVEQAASAEQGAGRKTL